MQVFVKSKINGDIASLRAREELLQIRTNSEHGYLKNKMQRARTT